MHADVIALRNFYASTLGRRVFQTLNAELQKEWPQLADERVLGFGFTTPYLGDFFKKAERCFAFMPARQGAYIWPSSEKVATSLVFEEDLPLRDGTVDRILLVHALEHAENAEEMLREMWRVLSPNGRILMVVPNRRGLWARYENSPFGSGQPYSGGQVLQLLRNANFTSTVVRTGLFFSPSQRFLPRLLSSLYGSLAARILPYFGGVLIIEAQKRLYQGVPVMRRQSRRVFVPALKPQTTTRFDGQA